MTTKSVTIGVRLLLMPYLLFHLSGCGVLLIGGAAAGTVGYVSGDLKATLEGRFEKVVEATDSAINDNSITQVTKDETQHNAIYELRTLQDDKVALSIVRASRDLTNITIRVGVFGDEPLSRRILTQIENRLK
ncbi:MAG: DUF3568 domain-containing protein [Desulfofustis sp.]|nr:DUF3568 domain-containing protein [Desulfofustis sp.]NNK58192.1 DUF3568 family protein [Desulfofustis sp.]